MKGLAIRALAALILSITAVGPNPGNAAESERVLAFASQIKVQADGGVAVTETITVVAAGRQIKRGIYRDFPTRYKDRAGNVVRVGFEIVSVLRDGRPEPYFLDDLGNGTRVYIGRRDVLLDPGRYTYELTYRTDRQLGLFDDHDELYWNVTGNGWALPIDHAGAIVELPPGARPLDTAAFTGPMGARGTAYSVKQDARGRIGFVTTQPLQAGEGLTIVVTWPKGFIVQPTTGQRVGYILQDNLSAFAGLAGLGLLVAYYLVAWLRVGRDPPAGTIVPLFSPPKGFSPAAVRMVTRMGFDHKAFAAAIVSMAVSGYLKIRQEENGDYVLERTGESKKALSPGERRIAAKLFGRAREIELKTANHARIKRAIDAFKASLRDDFERIHYMRNRVWLVPGMVLTLLAIGAMILFALQSAQAAFLMLWLAMWTAGCSVLGFQVVHAWRGGMRPGTVFVSLFALPFFGGELVGLWQMNTVTSPLAVLALLAIVLVNVLFYHLIKAPTIKGRKVMDQIEGFRQYLTVAEKERMNLLNPPERTPELFEKFLPYALALDVEHEWSEQFAEALADAQNGYAPAWYAGSAWRGDSATGLADSLGGGFAGAISSASSPPGSSSGGGGGFSGGGGGGGGGGGW
ncbi:MAG: DUF2207 domain-containing protein [Alphaproteobacteria bacterium]